MEDATIFNMFAGKRACLCKILKAIIGGFVAYHSRDVAHILLRKSKPKEIKIDSVEVLCIVQLSYVLY